MNSAEHYRDDMNQWREYAARQYAARIDAEMCGVLVRAAENAPKPTRWQAFRMNTGHKWRSFWARLIPGRLQAAVYAWKHYGEEDYE